MSTKTQGLTIYLSALDCYKNNQMDEYSELLKNSELSVVEKKLLQARLTFRDKKWDEGIDDLVKIKTEMSDFLRAETNALISYAYSMKGDWQSAIIYNESAAELYQKLDYTKQTYNCFYNQSVYYARLGLLEIGNHYLDKAQVFASSLMEKAAINRALASNLSKSMKYPDALKHINKDIKAFQELEMNETIAIHFLVAADIYCCLGDYKKAQEFIKTLTNVKKVPFRARILFEQYMLEAFLSSGSAMVEWPEVVMEDDLYSLKAQVINHLLSGRQPEAKDAWIKLAQKEPNNYLPNFEVKYQSDRNSLYFKFISKIKSGTKEAPAPESLNDSLSGKALILYTILYQASFPISKEDLIEKVWELPYEPSYDSRFYKLIQRLKEASICKIENLNGGYLIK